jgi:hypothetical protein
LLQQADSRLRNDVRTMVEMSDERDVRARGCDSN